MIPCSQSSNAERAQDDRSIDVMAVGTPRQDELTAEQRLEACIQRARAIREDCWTMSMFNDRVAANDLHLSLRSALEALRGESEPRTGKD